MNYERLRKKDLIRVIKNFESKITEVNNNSPVGLVILDDKGIIRDINLTLSEALGIERKNIRGTPFIIYIDKKSVTDYVNYLKRIAKPRESENIEINLVCRGNEIRTVQMYSKRIFDYKTKTNLIHNTIIDINEKKKAEKRLSESESRFKVLADSAPVFIWIMGPDKKYSYLNKEWLTLAGSTFDFGTGEGWMKGIHPDDLKNCTDTFNSAFEKREEFKLSYRVKDRQGEYRWLLEHGVPRYSDNEFLGYIGSCVDFTDQKNDELELARALREKIILVKEIHHRVKNNLQIITSLLNLQKYYIHNDQINEVITASMNRIRTMALVHENLYRSNNLSEIHFDIFLKNLINNILESYRISGQNIHIKDEIANQDLDADTAIYVGMIINELITNSLKYAFKDKDKGEIKINFKSLDGNKHQLEISDDGGGLPKGFDPNDGKTLGFLLIHSFVDQLNGRMSVTQNKGTKFKIVF